MNAHAWRRIMLTTALLATLASPSARATGDEPSLAALQAQAEQWQRQGFDEAEPVLAAIDRALQAAAGDRVRQRLLLRTRGAVAARVGRDTEVDAAIGKLEGLAAAGDAIARGDADLVRAVRDEQQGKSAESVTHAQRAADAYAAVCGRGPTLREDCDLRAQWLVQHMLLRRQGDDLDPAPAIARGDEAVALAVRAGDPALEAWTLATQAPLWAAKGDAPRARQNLVRADALLRDAHRPDVEARVALQALRTVILLDDKGQADQALAAAFAAARRDGSRRLLALVQANQADVLVRRGRPAEALQAVQAAMPVIRRVADRRIERVLLHNGALAHLALGHLAAAKAQVDRLLELWAAEGTLGEQSNALREVADALAAAGDAKGALELYHRERDVAQRIMEVQREDAERSVRARYDRDTQQRSIELKARDNAIQAAELDNRNLAQRLWALAAGVVGLAALLVGLLLRRVRATQLALRRSQAQLKVQSERDPLTGTANRRHGQERLQAEAEAGGGAWSGALLLVDVDHFKRVNDEHGHHVGDQVLIAVARRLQSAVREHDVVVRWGGEEFLVLAPSARGAALETLAKRLMQAVSAAPIELSDGRTVAVTVSVGYGAFPLGPREEPLGWERALNLADMALYTAKSQGRNRSVGVVALADDEHALAAAERDFERAWSDGRVRLAIEPGG